MLGRILNGLSALFWQFREWLLKVWDVIMLLIHGWD